MASVVHLRPHFSQDGAQRLLTQVETAMAAGADLGDRRAVIGELTQNLHRNIARLQNAMVELRAHGMACEPDGARIIRASEEACAEVLGRLGPLLKQADHVNVLLAAQEPDTPAQTMPARTFCDPGN